MKKKEMAKRIRNLENQLRRMDGKRQMEVRAIRSMAKRLNFDLNELLHGDSQPLSYIDEQFIHCQYCGNVILKEDKYCQYCGKPKEIELF